MLSREFSYGADRARRIQAVSRLRVREAAMGEGERGAAPLYRDVQRRGGQGGRSSQSQQLHQDRDRPSHAVTMKRGIREGALFHGEVM